MQEIRVFLRKEQIEKLRLTDRKTYGGYGGTTMTDYYLSRYVRYRVLEDGTIFRIEATPGELDKKKYQVSSLPSCKWVSIIHKEFISEGKIGDTYFGLEKINIEMFDKHGNEITKVVPEKVRYVINYLGRCHQTMIKIYYDNQPVQYVHSVT